MPSIYSSSFISPCQIHNLQPLKGLFHLRNTYIKYLQKPKMKPNCTSFSYNVFFPYFYLQSISVFLLPFVLLIFFTPPCSPVSLPGHFRDSQQLLSFKASIFNQSPLQNWVSSSTNPCSFTGITCKGSRVSSINLTNTMLSIDFGLVSSFLHNLENLESLVLKNTNLSGNIPELSFKVLSYLDLSDNNFTENFPSFQDCSSLQHLDLSSNSFSGNIDASLSSCYKLRFLNLSNNMFGGGVAKLPSGSLQYLYLGGNHYRGELPGHIGDLCTTLVELDLSSNEFSGMAPETLGDCLALELLDLSNNTFSGELPVETLLNLTSLKTLVLSFNNFVGGLSQSLSSLVNLETLDLSSNNISGLIPSGICKHPKNSLKMVYLKNNLFTGPIPESLSNCSQLESLDLSFNYLKGKIPSSLGSLLKLKDLMIWFNQLEGEIPLELRHLQSLESLILDFNQLSGSIPESLSNCTNLKWISLSNNLLSGAIPTSLGGLSYLTTVKLAKNSISGNIPAELGNCSSLLWLDLNTNFLNGSIPPALFKQSANISLPLLTGKLFWYIIWHDGSEQYHKGNLLEYFGIAHDRLDRILTRNHCKGIRMPPIFHHSRSMIFLDLSYNKLEGSIPKELGSMQYLFFLYLGHNDLSGPIPQELGGLQNVEDLDLSDNRLNGSIPQTLINLTSLSVIDLSNNQLSGMIPCSGQFASFLRESFANNSGLSYCPHPQDAPEPSPSLSSISKSSGTKQKKHYIIIGCGVIAGVLIWLVTQLLVIRLTRKGRMENDGEEWSMVSFQRLGFNKWDILGGLTDQNLVGNGGSGKVYRVITKKGKKVAVKSIRHEQKERQGLMEKQFLAEVKILGGIWHNNIVKLLCCIRGKTTKLLVYEYMDKQCVYKWLHGKKRGLTTQVLQWERRLKIAIGASQGLCYMHHSCDPPIIHRDIKSSNILVDSNFNAKIADFGLAKMMASEGDPETASAVVGTFGYIAPEYGSTRKVDAKSDIYSFGVVLLELTTGREAVTGNEDMNLAQWAHKHQREGKSAADVLDEEIKEPRYLEAMITVFKLGLACTLSSPSSRPSMKDVSQILQRCSENNHMSPES
ncbi:systemin receptor SR160-like [Ipomoea triloba]|uniref:systemin receptor SR160-like n=1 Tax=Ipomoea triloba TaxID=35885 RepID=UPI00125CF81E|nr:systemin receptor SR160-like [Ipomoea triloba]